MRERFLTKVGEHTSEVLPMVNLKCTDKACNHENCIQDEESGEWYRKHKTPYQPQEDEAVSALLMVQIKELKLIRKMMVYFTVLSITGLVASLIYALQIAHIFR